MTELLILALLIIGGLIIAALVRAYESISDLRRRVSSTESNIDTLLRSLGAEKDFDHFVIISDGDGFRFKGVISTAALNSRLGSLVSECDRTRDSLRQHLGIIAGANVEHRNATAEAINLQRDQLIAAEQRYIRLLDHFGLEEHVEYATPERTVLREKKSPSERVTDASREKMRDTAAKLAVEELSKAATRKGARR